MSILFKSEIFIMSSYLNIKRSQHSITALFTLKKWKKELQFLSTLRADMTQDEGSYSSFLDRDDWYERQRQQNAKKLDKKKFGNLLDGIP